MRQCKIHQTGLDDSTGVGPTAYKPYQEVNIFWPQLKVNFIFCVISISLVGRLERAMADINDDSEIILYDIPSKDPPIAWSLNTWKSKSSSDVLNTF
jgi:hypothetical protein